jgi:hypothetical protein
VAETEKVAVSANEGMHERTPSPIRAHKVVLTFISSSVLIYIYQSPRVPSFELRYV